jgi:hypothetical protein
MVSLFTRRLGAGCSLFVSLMVLVPGCGQKNATPVRAVVEPTAPESEGPAEIELSDPKVTLAEPTLVQFEVKYRFTKGKPSRVYACDIDFPGTENHAVKKMESWQLQTEGVIKDGVVLRKPPVEEFEITMSEAATAQNPSKKISNTVSGPVR